ncbi:MAG: hypothetical protein OEV15_04660, partial [Gallionella sp.]|nr:hypothetical protein [Gallionella sp.]
ETSTLATEIDTVESMVSYTLGDNVENLILSEYGGSTINGTGNALDNVIVGNAGNNTLNGGAGADTMIGGAGDDTYHVDDLNDVITELAGEGNDTVKSTISYTLSMGGNIENLILLGTGQIDGTGNELDNIIKGNANDNVLDGGAGNDWVYYNAAQGGVNVDLSLSIAQDTGSAGWDTLLNFEYLLGSQYNDTLIGDASANLLHGNSGADTLIGGLGNDTYFVDNIGDTVIETSGLASEIDTVKSSINYSLAEVANVENLTLTGTAAIDGTGNTLDNLIIGNASDNILDGGGGNDTLSGGKGNDTYIVNNTGITVIEYAGNGSDTVQSSISYVLSANVENLTLTGVAAIDGTGNTLDNMLYGNAAANILVAGAGNDLLDGGSGNDILKGDAGNDVLEGGDGNDTLSDTAGNNLFNGGAGIDTLTGSSGNELFIGGVGNDTITTGTGADIIAFNKGDGQDTLVASAAADNTLSLGGGIQYANLALSKSGNDLIFATGGGDQINLQNWYSGTGNHSIANLQLVLDATAYDAGSTDPLLNQQVQSFDFAALAQAFDIALGIDPGLTSWGVAGELLTAHLAGSDTAALGGDLAYQYNLNGTLAGIGLAPAQNVINDANFGVAPQLLQPLASLQTGTVRLG